MKWFCKGNKKYACSVALFGIGIRSRVRLGDYSLALVLICCVFKWFWVLVKPKQISPALFLRSQRKYFSKMSCFSFITAAVIKQEHVIILRRCFRTRCFLHEHICFKMCSRYGLGSLGILKKAALDLSSLGFWEEHLWTLSAKIHQRCTPHTICQPRYDVNTHLFNWTFSLFMLQLICWQLWKSLLMSSNFKFKIKFKYSDAMSQYIYSTPVIKYSFDMLVFYISIFFF